MRGLQSPGIDFYFHLTGVVSVLRFVSQLRSSSRARLVEKAFIVSNYIYKSLNYWCLPVQRDSWCECGPRYILVSFIFLLVSLTFLFLSVVWGRSLFFLVSQDLRHELPIHLSFSAVCWVLQKLRHELIHETWVTHSPLLFSCVLRTVRFETWVTHWEQWDVRRAEETCFR